MIVEQKRKILQLVRNVYPEAKAYPNQYFWKIKNQDFIIGIGKDQKEAWLNAVKRLYNKKELKQAGVNYDNWYIKLYWIA